MKDADSAKLREFKDFTSPINSLTETKLKHLEARLIGPNSEGTMPVLVKPITESDLEEIKLKINKSENNTVNNTQNEPSIEMQKDQEHDSQNNQPQNNLLTSQFGSNPPPLNPVNYTSARKIDTELIHSSDFFKILKENQKDLILGENNNSNKSQANSNKRKTPPRKNKNPNLSTNDFISHKRSREIITPQIEDEVNNSNQNLLDGIEFSSKNNNSQTPLFNSKLKVTSRTKKSESKKSEINYSNYKLEKNYIQTSINIKTPNTNYNLNNLSSLQTPDSNFRVMKKLQDENEKLYKELNEIKKEILDRENKLSHYISENEELAKNLTIMSKQNENQLGLAKAGIVKYLKELEEMKRKEKKKWLNEMEFKLGKYTLQRVGQTAMDVWENGEDFINLNKRIREVEVEKEKLEKQKKNLQNIQKKRSTTNNEEYYESDINECKELINFKLSVFQKEESDIKEQINKLEIEKLLMLLEKKRLKEEESSRFRGLQSKDKFPVLSGRYLILSLLGKGGYSEVYKAYDLENHIEVACKIHQLNPQWSDSLKDNYIRHTIRENQIQKLFLHSKIVRHYDTIEIDLSSFCTVLELCSGPDLHTYLKMHKQLTEKEARGIIVQILAGLEYLNKLPNKIIHFDLKPQNIIFHNMEVKISDFGLAKIMEGNRENIELTSQGVGTYWYLPPECFDTSRNPPGISSKVDIWSVGVILFECIYGFRPFGHNQSQDKILQEGIILNANKIDFPAKPIISKQCQDFIEKCLEKKQQKRMDVFEAMEHEFIKPRKNAKDPK